MQRLGAVRGKAVRFIEGAGIRRWACEPEIRAAVLVKVCSALVPLDHRAPKSRSGEPEVCAHVGGDGIRAGFVHAGNLLSVNIGLEGKKITYAESPALTWQHPQAVSLYPISITEAVLEFVMHELYSSCALVTDRNTLPRLHEQPLGALSGAGQYGIGSVATGHWTKYAATSSSYSQEYTLERGQLRLT